MVKEIAAWKNAFHGVAFSVLEFQDLKADALNQELFLKSMSFEDIGMSI